MKLHYTTTTKDRIVYKDEDYERYDLFQVEGLYYFQRHKDKQVSQNFEAQSEAVRAFEISQIEWRDK